MDINALALLVLCFVTNVTGSTRSKTHGQPQLTMTSSEVSDAMITEQEVQLVKEHLRDTRARRHNHPKKGKGVELAMQYCRPYPSLVQVTELGDWEIAYFPSFVELHRCAGGCYLSPNLEQCVVIGEENIAISVKIITFDLKSKTSDTVVMMSNHTACDCACVPKQCNARQRFNDAICGCECIHDGSSCNEQQNSVWDQRSCECVCKIKNICPHGSLWSDTFCSCVPTDMTGRRL